MARIKKNRLTVTVDGDEVTPDVSNLEVRVGDADTDFVSFADAALGGTKEWTLAMTIAQDTAAGSLWRQIWDNVGAELDVVVRPNGNATPSANEPHFTGTVIVKYPDGLILGGDADVSETAVQTVDVEWVFTEKPALVTA